MRSSGMFAGLGVAVFALTLLSACGGGGGGGGGDGGPTTSFSLSTNAINFDASSTVNTPGPQTITATVTGVTSGTLYIYAVATGSAVSAIGNITITGTTTGQADVFPTHADVLGPGDYTGTVTVRACTTDATCSGAQLTGSPKTINVTYKVHGVRASAAALTFDIGDASVPADYSQSITVNGASADTWTAASDAAWLSVTPTGGSGGSNTTVTATLDQAQLNAFSNGTYTAKVTLTPSAGLAVQIPVTVNIARAEVASVSPYVGTSGVSQSVIIRGSRFQTDGALSVTFGTTAAASFTVMSDTEIHADYPALSVGSYPVHVQNNRGTDRTAATLVIVDPPAFAPTVLHYPVASPNDSTNRVIDVVYDAERQALLVGRFDPTGGVASNELLRYAYTGTWGAPARRSLPGLSVLALSIDGRTLIGGDGPSNALQIERVDPVTLATLGVVSWNGDGFRAMATVNDGTTVLTTDSGSVVGYVDRTRTIAPLQPGALANVGDRSGLGAVADGSRAIVTYSRFNTGNASPIEYVAATGQLVLQAQVVDRKASAIAASGDGLRLLFDYTDVTDAGYNLLGSLPSGGIAAVLSPDHRRAYTYNGDGVLHAFDLTATPVSGQFPQIGSGTTLQANPGVSAKMTISPDGGTLFIAASDAIVVQPAP